jgi:hypothetical protein
MTSLLPLLLSSVCGLALAETAEPLCDDRLGALAPRDRATNVPVDVMPALTVHTDCDRHVTVTLADNQDQEVIQADLEPNDVDFLRLDPGTELEPDTTYEVTVRGDELDLTVYGFTTGRGRVLGASEAPIVSHMRLIHYNCDETFESIRPTFEATVGVAHDPDGLATVALVEPERGDSIHGPYIAGDQSEVVIPRRGYTSLTVGEEHCVQAIQYDGRGQEVGRSELTCGIVEQVDSTCDDEEETGPVRSALDCGGCASGTPAGPAGLVVVGLVLVALTRRD